MSKFRKGENLLTQGQLKEYAKTKQRVWVVWTTGNPYDKGKEISKAVIPEPTPNNDGFYLGNACWDNLDDDRCECCSEGYDCDVVEIYEAILMGKNPYAQKSFYGKADEFIKTLPEYFVEILKKRGELEKCRRELISMLKSVNEDCKGDE